MKNWHLVSFIFLILLGCQTPSPTRVTETQMIDLKELSEQMNGPIKIDEDLVVIDSRSRFDYTMAHVRGSIHLSWDELGPIQPIFSPENLQKTTLSVQRLVNRLALMGIHPSARILILGKGLKGNGEEGQLAWALLYLGINKIQIADIESLARLLTNVETSPRKNAESWVASFHSSLMADRDEVLSAAVKKSSEKSKVHLIDVRSKKEFFHKDARNSTYQYPELNALNIEWKEFFQADGRPNLKMRDRLRATQIQLSDRIIVISEKGGRSAAVTMALLAMGFKQAANYLGGYQELVGTRH